MVRPSRRIPGSFVLAPLLSLALASGALATSPMTYSLSGFEVAATATVGTFVGVGKSADDFGTWSASIVHTALSDAGTATIVSGPFTYHGKIRDIAGSFNGGSLSQTFGFTGCTNQTYTVTGSLALTSPSSGSATFSAVLTHYRIRLFGRCIVYAATVIGRAVFSF